MKTKTRILFAGLVGWLAAGCTEAGRSIVLMEIKAGASLAGAPTSIKVTAKQSNNEVASHSWTWNPAGLKVGLHLPASVSGQVLVEASSIGLIEAHASATVMVTPGKATIPVTLTLEPGPPPNPPDGGSGGSGGGMGGGPGGSGGGIGGGPGGSGGGIGGSDASVDTPVDGPRPDGGTDTPVVQRAWTPAAHAEMNIDEVDTQPRVAIDPTGNAALVWVHGGLIWVNVYNATSKTWGTAGSLGSPAISGDGPQIGVDGKGSATVIWARPNDTPELRGIWSSTASFAGGGAWSAPTRISSGRAFGPELVIGADGSAIAAWTENNLINGNNEYIVWVSSRPLNGSWAPARAIQNARDVGDRNPRVAMDGAGNGFVIWQQAPPQPDPNDDTTSVWISRYTGGNFGAPMVLETYTDGSSDSVNVSMNAGGAAIATWAEGHPDRHELWSRRFISGSWAAPMMVTMASAIDWIFVPETAIDTAGNVVAVWSQTLASGSYNARIARLRVGQATWDAPIPLETDNTAPSGSADAFLRPWADVGVDGNGNAHALWRKRTGTGLVTLVTRRMDATGTLGPEHRLDTENVHNVHNPQLEVALNGTAIAVWYHAIELNIWASIFR